MATQGLTRLRFGDFLVERKIISEGELLDALAEHWMSGRRIGESIARKGYLPAHEVERLAREYESLSTVYV
jgi:hypothetical protein